MPKKTSLTKTKSSETPIRLSHCLMTTAVFLILLGLIELYSMVVDWERVIPQNLWLVGAGMLLFILSMLVRPGSRLESLCQRVRIPAQVGWLLMAVMFSVLAAITMDAFEKSGKLNYIPVIIFWLSAGAVFVAAFQPHLPEAKAARDWLKQKKTELVMIGLVVLLGAGLRFYKLGSAPFVLNGDEGRMGLQALNTNSTSLANPFALWENFGALYLQAIDTCFKFFGATAFSLRLLPALGGILAIVAVYLLARTLFGTRVALLSAILVAISHTHIHFSRTAAVGYIQATWLVPLELYLLLTGIDRRSSWRAALGGVLLGIHYSVYLTSQLVTVLAALFVLAAIIFFRKWMKAAWRQALAFFSGLAVMLIPEALYVIRHPNLFFERITIEGTFQSGWLGITMASTGKGMWQLLGERVLHAFLSLFYYPAIDFYGSTVPMLSMISALLFLVGLLIVLLRKQTPGSLLLNGYFWGFTLSVGLFAIPPSADSYRMLIALPAALIMAGLGLDTLLETMGLSWEKKRVSYIAVSSVALFSLLIFNMWSYYDDFIGHCIYGDNLEGRFASYLGTYAGEVEDQDVLIYLLSDEVFFYGSHASANFLSGNRPITNVGDGLDDLSLLPGDILIASPNRFDDLKDWVRRNPQARIDYQYDCQVPIMAVYEVP